MLDFLIRFRTWLLGAMGIFALLLPDLLPLIGELAGSPQLVAALPEAWRTWAGVVALLCTVWSRWRPAARTGDAEVQVKMALRETEYPATVVVEAGGETRAIING
jgi:hypothetical protein